MENIIVTHVYPPIPDRRFDWNAYRDPESRYQGWGPSYDAAVTDLLEMEAADEEADDPTPYQCECGARFEEATSVLCCMENNHQ